MRKKRYLLLFIIVMYAIFLFGCETKEKQKETVLIYTSINTDRISELQELLDKEFPEYNCIVEYQSTSKSTAQLLAEGTSTSVDIIHDLAYTNIAKLSEEDYLADLSGIVDYSNIVDYLVPDSKDYFPECVTGGCFIINVKVLNDMGLEVPNTYEDLLKPCYKGLISMPDPKSSGTGYMFIKALSNSWQDDERVMEYFKELDKNILAYTSSGNGPINSVKMEETAIGLGMTANVVQEYNKGATDLAIVIPNEGSPYSAYGQGIIRGKETKESVLRVFNYLTTTYFDITLEKYAPEKMLKDRDCTIENFPENIFYADMSNNTSEEKDRLLKLWDEKVVK